ncbi:hypothetical protein D3C72_1306160 [compost metagenome]
MRLSDDSACFNSNAMFDCPEAKYTSPKRTSLSFTSSSSDRITISYGPPAGMDGKRIDQWPFSFASPWYTLWLKWRVTLSCEEAFPAI